MLSDTAQWYRQRRADGVLNTTEQAILDTIIWPSKNGLRRQYDTGGHPFWLSS